VHSPKTCFLLAATLLAAGCNSTSPTSTTTDTTTNMQNEDPINQTIPGATETNQSTTVN
jgi:uncharacterized lipoprotein YajG